MDFIKEARNYALYRVYADRLINNGHDLSPTQVKYRASRALKIYSQLSPEILTQEDRRRKGQIEAILKFEEDTKDWDKIMKNWTI